MAVISLQMKMSFTHAFSKIYFFYTLNLGRKKTCKGLLE